MARLEDLTTGTPLTGVTAAGTATVEFAQRIGEQGLKVIFRDSDGHLGDRFVYRDDEPSLELVEMGRPWSTREEARDAIGAYIEIFNNRIRRHSTIGGMSPAKFEELAQTKEVQAA